MGDHVTVFRSLRELFPQVDPRMLKAVAIEHHKDVDAAVVAVLDEVMPSMTGSVGISCVHHEAVASMANFVGTLSADHGTCETGGSSSAGHDVRVDEANGSVDSSQCTSSTEVITDTQENIVGELDVTPSYQGMSEQLNFTSHLVPELNDKQPALTNLKDLYLKLCSGSNLAHTDNEVGYGGYLSSEYIARSLMGENGNGSINLNVAQVQDRDTDNKIPDGDCIAQDNSLTSDLSDLYSKFWSEKNLPYSDNEVGYGRYLSNEQFIQSLVAENGNDSINLNVAQVQERDSDHIIPVGNHIAHGNSLKFPCDSVDMNGSCWKIFAGVPNKEVSSGMPSIEKDAFAPVMEFPCDSLKFPCDSADMNGSCWKIFAGVPNNEVSSGMPSIEKDAFAPAMDFPIPDIGESFVGSDAVFEQKDANSAGTDYNKQQSGNIVEHSDTLLSSKTDLLPDLNLNHFASMASTHSSNSVSIESLEDSIADAKNNKNDLLPSLELVTKMVGDVEHLEETAKVAKRESSVSGTSILTKVEELKEMLNHAKEANDMHAGEIFGEKSILTTEARELQSRLQRLSDERNSYLVVIEEIRQTLEERLIAAQQEIEAAEKEKIEKEASAQALLSEQEKEMNSIVEESRKLQKEAEENLKLKDFLVERGRIVDTLQGEMAVICEDVSQLKRIVDDRLSWSKLQLSTISSLSSSLHSSLHKSGSSSETVEAVESTDKHTVAEGASSVVEDPDVNERTVEMLDGCDLTDNDNSKRQDSKEDGWEFC